ncbi:hypothetical protein BE20_07750 [Sorangium cellulosum]|nr:hypothetical protein BE20_07750 [Sorangium cellulosum]
MLLVQLGEGLAAPVAAGDVETARVAHEAIGRLLGAPASSQGEARARAEGTMRSGVAAYGHSRPEQAYAALGVLIATAPRLAGAWTPAAPTALATKARMPDLPMLEDDRNLLIAT